MAVCCLGLVSACDTGETTLCGREAVHQAVDGSSALTCPAAEERKDTAGVDDSATDLWRRAAVKVALLQKAAWKEVRRCLWMADWSKINDDPAITAPDSTNLDKELDSQ
jgi:hypothetical protein